MNSLPIQNQVENSEIDSAGAQIKVIYTQLGPEIFTEVSSYPFPSDERERASLFAKPILSDRYLASRWFLRTLLSDEIGIASDKLEFSFNDYGKPLLEGSGQDTVHFNMSHCEDALVVAICRGSPVGIDIEAFRRLPDEETIVKQFFHQGEQREYLGLSKPLRPQAFLNGWTRKEAVIKALGTGLSTPLDSFRVSLDPRLPAKLIVAPPGNFGVESARWSLHSFELISGTTTAIAAPHPSPKISTEYKNAVVLFHENASINLEKASKSLIH